MLFDRMDYIFLFVHKVKLTKEKKMTKKSNKLLKLFVILFIAIFAVACALGISACKKYNKDHEPNTPGQGEAGEITGGDTSGSADGTSEDVTPDHPGDDNIPSEPVLPDTEPDEETKKDLSLVAGTWKDIGSFTINEDGTVTGDNKGTMVNNGNGTYSFIDMRGNKYVYTYAKDSFGVETLSYNGMVYHRLETGGGETVETSLTLTSSGAKWNVIGGYKYTVTVIDAGTYNIISVYNGVSLYIDDEYIEFDPDQPDMDFDDNNYLVYTLTFDAGDRFVLDCDWGDDTIIVEACTEIWEDVETRKFIELTEDGYEGLLAAEDVYTFTFTAPDAGAYMFTITADDEIKLKVGKDPLFTVYYSEDIELYDGDSFTIMTGELNTYVCIDYFDDDTPKIMPLLMGDLNLPYSNDFEAYIGYFEVLEDGIYTFTLGGGNTDGVNVTIYNIDSYGDVSTLTSYEPEVSLTFEVGDIIKIIAYADDEMPGSSFIVSVSENNEAASEPVEGTLETGENDITLSSETPAYILSVEAPEEGDYKFTLDGAFLTNVKVDIFVNDFLVNNGIITTLDKDNLSLFAHYEAGDIIKIHAYANGVISDDINITVTVKKEEQEVEPPEEIPLQSGENAIELGSKDNKYIGIFEVSEDGEYVFTMYGTTDNVTIYIYEDGDADIGQVSAHVLTSGNLSLSLNCISGNAIKVYAFVSGDFTDPITITLNISLKEVPQTPEIHELQIGVNAITLSQKNPVYIASVDNLEEGEYKFEISGNFDNVKVDIYTDGVKVDDGTLD